MEIGDWDAENARKKELGVVQRFILIYCFFKWVCHYHCKEIVENVKLLHQIPFTSFIHICYNRIQGLMLMLLSSMCLQKKNTINSFLKGSTILPFWEKRKRRIREKIILKLETFPRVHASNHAGRILFLVHRPSSLWQSLRNFIYYMLATENYIF